MRDPVEAAFLRQVLAIFSHQGCAHGDKSGDRVFVLYLAHDDDPAIMFDGIHADDTDIGVLHILGTPVVSGAAPHDVPAKIIDGDDLRRNAWLLGHRPLHLPSAVRLYYFEVASVIESP